MKFLDISEGLEHSNTDWYLEVLNLPDGRIVFEIAVREAPRHWRREFTTLSKKDRTKLIKFLYKGILIEGS
jgi:hypothetical protein